MNSYETVNIDRTRKLLPECMVLLRSDGKFPIDGPCDVALYGSGARRTIKGGTGSGEVNSRFFISVEQGLTDAGFNITTTSALDALDKVEEQSHKLFVKEIKQRARKKHIMPIMEGMGAIMPRPEYDIPADAPGDIAIYVLSRVSGEGYDRQYIKGDILLTDSEVRDILKLNSSFEKFMLVLNVGGPVDLTPVLEVKNILLLSQLGVLTGEAFASVLLGKEVPSGKLATTWATEAAYPSIGEFGDRDNTRYKEGVYVGYRYFDSSNTEPVFPFGFGLGYTTFCQGETSFEVNASKVTVSCEVSNTGAYKGKETMQLYVSVPSGKLDQPYQSLAAFAKTKELMPGGKDKLLLTFNMEDIASYEEESASYILESGLYVLRLGTSSRDTKVIGAVEVTDTIVVFKARNVLGKPDFEDHKFEIKAEVPEGIKKITLSPDAIVTKQAVYDSSESIDTPVAKDLTIEDLIYLNIGGFDPAGGIMSVVGAESKSVAGAAGETTALLKDKGITTIVMADGPAGVRLSRGYFVRDGKVLSTDLAIPETMQEFLPAPAKLFLKLSSPKPKAGEEVKEQYCTALPIGTAIAQSWNTELARICGDIAGDEMERFGIDLWLAPALNIHRDIRCGRNFEYYSEDPLISGLMAAGITNGVQAHEGCGTTIKHYAANNQETNRYNSNSIVSERAMREIYLRGFEICVKKSAPKSVMTSYNLLNGTHTSEHRGLIEDILRDEFGFEGLVMTDWIVNGGTQDKTSVHPAPEAYKVVNAGGDLFMPGGQGDFDNVLKAYTDDRVSRRQLEINATRVIKAMPLKV